MKINLNRECGARSRRGTSAPFLGRTRHFCEADFRARTRQLAHEWRAAPSTTGPETRRVARRRTRCRRERRTRRRVVETYGAGPNLKQSFRG